MRATSTGHYMHHPDRKSTRPGTTRRIRMEGYDYTSPGYYFITICTYDRQHLFGRIANESMQLTLVGQMLEDLIPESEQRFSTISIDSYVVMPNHIHLMVGLAVRMSDEGHVDNLSDIVRWIKDASVRRHSLGVKNHGWDTYQGRLWQKGFHDHIVRNEQELETLRRYIATNVESWEKDEFHDGFLDW